MNDLWNLNPTFNQTALIIAVEKKYKDIAELLLRHEGINVNKKDILNQSHSQNSNLSFFHIYYIQIQLFHKIEILNDL